MPNYKRKAYELETKQSEKICFAEFVLNYAKTNEIIDIDHYILYKHDVYFLNKENIFENETAILKNYHNFFETSLKYNGIDLFEEIRNELFAVVYKFGHDYFNIDVDWDKYEETYWEFIEYKKGYDVEDIFDYMVKAWNYIFYEIQDYPLDKIIENRNVKLMFINPNKTVFEVDFHYDNNNVFDCKLYIYDKEEIVVENMKLEELILENAFSNTFGY